MPTCLFCGTEGAVTTEHAPPKWTTKAYFKRHPDRDPNGIRKSRPDNDAPARHFSDWTDALCDDCRVWWNKNFEDAVRAYVEPILFGESITVSASEVPAAATWIGYQSMVRGIALKVAALGEFPKEDFRFIRDVGRLPDHQVLWIGCRGDEVAKLSSDPDATPWNYVPHCPGVWSTLFNLICRHHYDAPNAESARHEGEDDGSLVRVWPWRGGDLVWPPTTLLNAETIPKVANDAAKSSAG
jgi:hypothetical protein